MDALLATGVAWWDALEMVAENDPVGGSVILTEVMRSNEIQDSRAIRELADMIAKRAPEAADMAIYGWLNGQRHKGWLALEWRDWLTRLPDGLIVSGGLTLANCRGLKALPNGLRVGEAIDISGCENLESIPADIAFHGSLHATGCKSLKSLPEGFQVEGSCSLIGCVGLERLPEGFRTGGYLNLSGCSGLTGLPEGLTVVGTSFSMTYCHGIRSLPKGLDIRGSLYIEHCDGWDGRVPDDAMIGRLISDAHPDPGVTLAEWRELHPDGERAGEAR
jgi:hypothetical protein